MSLPVLAPLPGTVLPMAEVPDAVFAQELVGPGLAIDPPRTEEPVTAMAPVCGRVLKLHPHAFVLVAASGQGVLVHLGIDTVQLEGAGFTLHVAEGDQVQVRQPMVTFSPRLIADGGRSPVCPVVALEGVPAELRLVGTGALAAGDLLFEWSRHR
ncbi:PTS glucose transporter subunit IIA [Ruania suaedae]|uniref:PTS sugar transporter subunit IIA n=1 Tax=Ruania suaedae TaxID=2897774 RepID=UPI001E46394D|nr:PTS glucose transporter subunit IIA [Ruania suaedae]UFU04067.1 PTS glucose transporter subunit IIA [Ruania suaedae]